MIIDIMLIRHGQVDGNKEKRFVGVTDSPLTIEGRERIASLQYPKADLLYVSPLIRCRETARIIYPDMEQTIIDNVREMNFGSFEDKKFADLEGQDDFEVWNESGGKIAPPGGEAIDCFLNRVMEQCCGIQLQRRLASL